MEVDPVPVGGKVLQWDLNPHLFCGYRPTLLELTSRPLLFNDVALSAVPIDFITPDSERTQATLSAEDAQLISGVVAGAAPGPREKDATEGREAHPEALSPSLAATPADAVAGQFAIDSFIHPTRPHLKPKTILKLRPHPDVSFAQISLYAVDGYGQQDVECPASVLKCTAAAQRMKRFSFYEKAQGHGEEDEDQAKGGVYKYARDYICGASSRAQPSDRAYLVEKRITESGARPRRGEARLLPIEGAKLLLQKASAKLGKLAGESQTHKPFRLHLRKRTLEDEPLHLRAPPPAGAPAGPVEEERPGAADTMFGTSSESEGEGTRRLKRGGASTSPESEADSDDSSGSFG